MTTKESVRINLKGVQSVMVDAEILAEYKTTIEDLEQKLKQAEFDIQMWIGYRDMNADQAKRMKRYWKTEQAKNLNHKRWRQSL
mgnify:FL=1|jgi:predicted amino acid-binding ACT domain protein